MPTQSWMGNLKRYTNTLLTFPLGCIYMFPVPKVFKDLWVTMKTIDEVMEIVLDST